MRTHQTRRTAPAKTVRATPTKEISVECTVSTVWAMRTWPSGVCRVTSMGRRSPEVRAWAVTRTEVVGWTSVNRCELPSGKVNLSLLRVTTTVTGYGAEERTVTGMAARCAVKVTVRSVANVT